MLAVSERLAGGCFDSTAGRGNCVNSRSALDSQAEALKAQAALERSTTAAPGPAGGGPGRTGAVSTARQNWPPSSSGQALRSELKPLGSAQATDQRARRLNGGIASRGSGHPRNEGRLSGQAADQRPAKRTQVVARRTLIALQARGTSVYRSGPDARHVPRRHSAASGGPSP